MQTNISEVEQQQSLECEEDEESNGVYIHLKENNKEVEESIDKLYSQTVSDIEIADTEQQKMQRLRSIKRKYRIKKNKEVLNILNQAETHSKDDLANSKEIKNETSTVIGLDVEKPQIKEKINTKKTTTLPVYETDTSYQIEANDLPFKIGDRVYHPKHGKGIVSGFTNYSNKILFCQIEFENVGRRILDPRIAGIEKIEE